MRIPFLNKVTRCGKLQSSEKKYCSETQKKHVGDMDITRTWRTVPYHESRTLYVPAIKQWIVTKIFLVLNDRFELFHSLIPLSKGKRMAWNRVSLNILSIYLRNTLTKIHRVSVSTVRGGLNFLENRAFCVKLETTTKMMNDEHNTKTKYFIVHWNIISFSILRHTCFIPCSIHLFSSATSSLRVFSKLDTCPLVSCSLATLADKEAFRSWLDANQHKLRQSKLQLNHMQKYAKWTDVTVFWHSTCLSSEIWERSEVTSCDVDSCFPKSSLYFSFNCLVSCLIRAITCKVNPQYQ